ncbi:MAG: glucokinase [Chloroflexi bacterium]|nr:MAG: glucokinase [Chloroflexota bacterium]
MLLAGDIGGTKTVLALYAPDNVQQAPIAEVTFPSREFASLSEIVARFLAEHGQAAVKTAVFGVAGPVMGNRAETTNLPWVIDGEAMAAQFGFQSVKLLNDLQAIANAVPFLREDDLFTLNQGKPVPKGTIGVIAPGTGLGEAFLTWNGRSYTAHPSEGGHTSFAPTTPTHTELLTYMQTRFPRVSYERVCSGSGIPNLYAFLRDTGRFPEPTWLREALAASDDPTPVIVQAAQAEKSELCQAALSLFLEILGDEAGNLALKLLATGGIYLGGGIPPRILPQLQNSAFMRFFVNKGRFSALMAEIPVHVICNPKVALLGAAMFGRQVAKNG